MSDKGLFGGLFDFNHDGKMDSFEKAAEFATFMHIVNESEKEETDTSGTSINSTYHTTRWRYAKVPRRRISKPQGNFAIVRWLTEPI